MNRKKFIQDSALYYAKKSIRDKGIAYLEFVEAAEFADRTMIDKVHNLLQDIDFKTDYITIDNDGRTVFTDKFIEEFCKTLEK